jgi:hypothetical protein
MDLAEENMSRGVDVILESTFNYESEGEVLGSWKEKYRADIYTLVLEIDEEERKSRFETRERARCHHDKKREYGELTCDYAFMPEKKLFLRSDEPVEKIANKAVGFINYANKDKQ